MGLNNVDDSRDGMKRFLRRNPNTSFVAEIDFEIVGAILCGHDGRSGYIKHACVSREHQNNKIGTQLVEKVFDALKAEEISDVTLAVYRYKNKALVELEWYD